MDILILSESEEFVVRFLIGLLSPSAYVGFGIVDDLILEALSPKLKDWQLKRSFKIGCHSKKSVAKKISLLFKPITCLNQKSDISENNFRQQIYIFSISNKIGLCNSCDSYIL